MAFAKFEPLETLALWNHEDETALNPWGGGREGVRTESKRGSARRDAGGQRAAEAVEKALNDG